MEYGLLTVLADTGAGVVKCQCACGVVKSVRLCNLRSGATRSCGCRQGKWTHGQYKTPEYRAWAHMKERCSNPKCREYKNYGDRGITVCRRWFKSFEHFLEDMGKRPSERHSLDRYPDNNGNYEPDNCRWATTEEQAANKRSNKILTFQGQTKLMKDWCKELGLSVSTVGERLRRYGWTVEQALSLAPQKGKRP